MSDQRSQQTPGTVALVGAGPGDPELITVKGRRRLEDADVVFYDNRIGDGVLDFCSPRARLIDVGKIPGGKSTSQQVINALMVKEARGDQRVVRLKGGDPFVFGRGGEEAVHLRQHEVPVEIVPGVSSCIGVPAAAGVPVTHRGVTTNFSVVTGMTATKDLDELADEWRELAEASGTVVFLMGVGRLESIVDALREAGLSGDTPAAMIESGTLEGQRTASSDLADIVALVRDAGIEPPATFVVGQVAGLQTGIGSSRATPGGRADTSEATATSTTTS
ncbi:MAG: uroporphyrinogen-III C-methyltransferase [Bradymonadaceae bacterium]